MYCRNTESVLQKHLGSLLQWEKLLEKTSFKPNKFTLVPAVGPSHWPQRPFGPKNECLDKVSLFG